VFRIRRIHDDTLPLDQEAISQVQDILRSQFGALSENDVRKLRQQLRNPMRYRFRSILFVADNSRGKVRGFALLQHAPDLKFCYLDFISVAPKGTGGGIGGALYERVREEAFLLDAIGLFFECLPDEVRLCRIPRILRQNRARLRFYERYGARPIINTAYETPLKPADVCPPHLVFDAPGRDSGLSRDQARGVVRAVLERKYGKSCPAGYIDMVVASIQDDPVRLREPRYGNGNVAPPVTSPARSVDKSIALVVNDKHAIHHVHERGYVESPVRIASILRGIADTNLFSRVPVHHFSERIIKEVHDVHYVEYLKRTCTKLEEGESVYPYVFPIRNATRPPRELPIRAGYYCIDTFTPLNRNAYMAAKRAVDCALTAARAILQGSRLAYALVRPPGHHAERRAFGGFCYFNSTAVAAHYLSPYGKVAILDIDYHHGNGTQNIFYERSDVLTISIHGHPHFAYPYFTGFHDERGRGAGVGYNLNLPLPEQAGGSEYREALARALRRVNRFDPQFLVVAFGLDPAKADPTGSWRLEARDFEANGRMIGSLGIPTLVVQEGGYRVRSLGTNARRFFLGLWDGFHGRRPGEKGPRAGSG
jgi:acetoin utilization deacetylase AcuC-like enzyme/GNAT superfamily N-acetyltransferase